jgi:hypothetical protein
MLRGLTIAVAAFAAAAQFEVASVKPSLRQVGPDYNNQFTFQPSGLTARNATLRRLIAQAYAIQIRQVIGPNWLDQNEYDLEARTASHATPEDLSVQRRYGFHFHGDMRRFADYLAVQLSIPIMDDSSQPARAAGPAIPVLDKTNLAGVQDLTIKPEPARIMQAEAGRWS